MQDYEDLKSAIAANPDVFTSNLELVAGLANLFLARENDPAAIRELAGAVIGQLLDIVKAVGTSTQ